jgi:homoserine O-acetyltransferase
MPMHRRVVTAAVVAALLLHAAVALAHAPHQPPHQQYKIGDLKLESGEVIKDFAISYVTHGTLNAQKSNAILMVTAISGNHHRLDFLIGPGKALDTTKYFIVTTDAIGNGLTTSPSNSTAQPRMRFPRFLIRDMVTSQHKLMTEHLGISHVLAVVGPSMGGMQALQWGVSHPDFMDSLVALVPLARTPAWSVVVMEASRKAIMLDPAWNGGNYTAPPAGVSVSGATSSASWPREPPRCTATSSRTRPTCCRGSRRRKTRRSRSSTPTTGSTRRGPTTPTTSAPRRA